MKSKIDYPSIPEKKGYNREWKLLREEGNEVIYVAEYTKIDGNGCSISIGMANGLILVVMALAIIKRKIIK